MTPVTDDHDKLCELETRIAVIEARKADAEKVHHAFWAAVLAIFMTMINFLLGIATLWLAVRK